MRGSLSCSSANARRRSAETRRPPLEPNSSASPDHVTRPTRSARSSPHQPLTLDVHLGAGVVRRLGMLHRNAIRQLHASLDPQARCRGKVLTRPHGPGLREDRALSPGFEKSQCHGVFLCLQVTAILWPKLHPAEKAGPSARFENEMGLLFRERENVKFTVAYATICFLLPFVTFKPFVSQG